MTEKRLKKDALIADGILIAGLAVYVVMYVLIRQFLNLKELTDADAVALRSSLDNAAVGIRALCCGVYRLGLACFAYAALRTKLVLPMKKVSLYFAAQLVVFCVYAGLMLLVSGSKITTFWFFLVFDLNGLVLYAALLYALYAAIRAVGAIRQRGTSTPPSVQIDRA